MAEKPEKAVEEKPVEKVEVPVELTSPPRAPAGKTIETYAEELGTDPAIFAGVKARERWAAQRHVTKATYEKAVDKFLNGPTVLKGGE